MSESKWQPIATAPKDGTQLLGYCDYAQNGRAFWVAMWIDDADELDGGFWLDAGKQDSMSRDAEPTHWQPLPEPPDAEQAARENA